MLNTKSAPNELDVHALLRTFSWLRFGVAFIAVFLLVLSCWFVIDIITTSAALNTSNKTFCVLFGEATTTFRFLLAVFVPLDDLLRGREGTCLDPIHNFRQRTLVFQQLIDLVLITCSDPCHTGLPFFDFTFHTIVLIIQRFIG